MARRRYRDRVPLAVLSLAFLTAVDGAVAIVEGIGFVGPAPPLGILFLVVGVAELILAYGLYELEPYAYAAGMFVLGVGLAVDLFTANAVGAAMSGFNMYVLYRHRGVFRK